VLARISASTASVGIPRSISQIRAACPYCCSIRGEARMGGLVGRVPARPRRRAEAVRVMTSARHLHAIGALVPDVAEPSACPPRRTRVLSKRTVSR